MNYDDVIALYKTQAKIAQALGISQTTVSLWRVNGGRIPRFQQLRLASLNRGVLKPDDDVLELRALRAQARARARRRKQAAAAAVTSE
jgi:hypothetical protein